MPGGVAPTAIGALSKTFQAASKAICAASKAICAVSKAICAVSKVIYAVSKAICAVSKDIYVVWMTIYAISKAIIWTRSSAEPAWEVVKGVLVGRISEPTLGLNAESAECDAKVAEGGRSALRNPANGVWVGACCLPWD